MLYMKKQSWTTFLAVLLYAKKLRSFGTFTVGTQRSNSKKYPPALKDKALLKILKRWLPIQQVVKEWQPPFWKDTKEVLLISIVHCLTGCDIVTITQNDCFLWKTYLPHQLRKIIKPHQQSVLLFFHDILPSLLHPEDQLELLLS